LEVSHRQNVNSHDVLFNNATSLQRWMVSGCCDLKDPYGPGVLTHIFNLGYAGGSEFKAGPRQKLRPYLKNK
jgi:hypothetical protein